MRRAVTIVALATSLASAGPLIAQAQGVPQMLQGLMTGNQNQDQAIRDAYERGYQRGRQDEAQMSRRGNQRSSDDDGYGRRPPPPPYDSRGNDYRR